MGSYKYERGYENVALFPLSDTEEENMRYISAYINDNKVMFGVTMMKYDMLNNPESNSISGLLIQEVDCRDAIKKLLRRWFLPNEINNIMDSYGVYFYKK